MKTIFLLFSCFFYAFITNNKINVMLIEPAMSKKNDTKSDSALIPKKDIPKHPLIWKSR